MKVYPAKWTDRDFDSLSWHDNRIYSMRILNPRNGYNFDLVFEIDHILEWILKEDNTFEFVVAPARLTFSMVDKLVVDFRLTYKEDWEIDEIQRIEATDDPRQDTGLSEWRIKMQSFLTSTSR